MQQRSVIWPTDLSDLRALIRTITYLICWAISEIPRLSHTTPEWQSSRYSVYAGTLCVKFRLLQICRFERDYSQTDGRLVPVHLNVDCYRTINNLRSHSRFQPRVKVWDREEEGVHSSCAQVR